MMGLRRPKSEFLGGDFAGIVEAVGPDGGPFQPGDEVFGASRGSFADYVNVSDGIALKPANLSFEEAAAVPLAGLTALQALRDHGQLQPGDDVLINGASGGVGTFAVQIAKALGASVTAVCSTANVDRARSIGADHVIDYTQQNFTKGDRRYDLIFDNAGSRSWWACTRVLKPQARVVLVGGPMTSRLLGPLGHIGVMKFAAWPSKHTCAFFIANLNRADMDVLRELLEKGQVKPVVDRRYEVNEIADALRYMGQGHAQGKIVVSF
jgi:NADPH:quinone reductase-like Zn-dependent oxidoreductase